MNFKGLLKYIDIKGLLVEGVMKEILEPAIAKLVASSSNKYDDALVPLLLPLVEQEAQVLADKLVALVK